MRLNQVRLQNFKLFRKAEINFRPITLLTGTNNSGKTSVLNAITAILQTTPPHDFPFELIPNGSNCNLGSYRNIVSLGNTKTPFSIGLSISQGDTTSLLDAQYRYSASGGQILPAKIMYRKMGEELLINWTGQANGYKAFIKSDEFKTAINDESFIELTRALKAAASSMTSKAQIAKAKRKKVKPEQDVKEYFQEQAKKTGVWFPIETRSPREIPRELGRVVPAATVIKELARMQSAFRESFNYIGPVRAYPRRYYLTEDSGSKVEPSGKNAITMLYEWRRHYPRRFDEVVKLAKMLELVSGLDAGARLDEVLKVDIQPFKRSETVSYADVGFGISQALPILIADVALPKEGTLIVNQPEVHLHPSSQARLANYFTSRLATRNYIIETHSEYLINRLRLLVVQGNLKPDDVSILFFDRATSQKGTPRIYDIKMDKQGALIDAPRRFFETYYLDTYKLAMGAFKESKNA